MTIFRFENPHSRTEGIFRAAEISAGERKKGRQSVANNREGNPLDEKQILARANLELKRLSIRARLLPHEIASEGLWMSLVDILVSQLHHEPLCLADCDARWSVSETTAMRRAAALIAAGLVARKTADSEESPSRLVVTDEGRAVLAAILSADPYA